MNTERPVSYSLTLALLWAMVAGVVASPAGGSMMLLSFAVAGSVVLLLTLGLRAPAGFSLACMRCVWSGVRSLPSYVAVIWRSSVPVPVVLPLVLVAAFAGRGVELPSVDWKLPAWDWRIDWPDVIPDITPKPPAPEVKATAATFVYEKDDHSVPGFVLSAFNRMNRDGHIVATLLEADPQDGTGNVPDQYRVALAAAKEAGLPCLVVTAGDKVLSVVKDAKDEQAVLESVK